MDYIRGKNLVAGTYTCGMEHGTEYGFTFTLPFEGDDQSDMDTVFDLPIGFVHKDMPPEERVKKIEADWEKFKWAAEAIVRAAPGEGK